MDRSLVFFAILVFVLGGCNKESVTEPSATGPTSLPVRLIKNLPADTGSVGKSTYFSFRDSSIVAGIDTLTTLWDLAFRTTTIRTNSGASGPGQGGAIVLTGTDLDTLSLAPATGYAIDTSSTQLAIRTGSGNGWYNYNFATNIISPIPGRVLIIRTGDGKYVKVQILSYYKGAPTSPAQSNLPRYYTFKYVYQPDGSRRLK